MRNARTVAKQDNSGMILGMTLMFIGIAICLV